MRKQLGVTLIEVIIFIIVMGFLASAIILVTTTTLTTVPTIHKNTIALQTAQQCMEWFIGQKRLNGYSSITCPSTSVPTFCTTPSGYNLAVNITCTTINGDSNFKKIVITVSGTGAASLSTLIASY